MWGFWLTGMPIKWGDIVSGPFRVSNGVGVLVSCSFEFVCWWFVQTGDLMLVRLGSYLVIWWWSMKWWLLAQVALVFSSSLTSVLSMALKMILNTMPVLISRTKGAQCPLFQFLLMSSVQVRRLCILDICLQTKSLVIMTPTGNAAGCKTLRLQKLQVASHDAHTTQKTVQCQWDACSCQTQYLSGSAQKPGGDQTRQENSVIILSLTVLWDLNTLEWGKSAHHHVVNSVKMPASGQLLNAYTPFNN